MIANSQRVSLLLTALLLTPTISPVSYVRLSAPAAEVVPVVSAAPVAAAAPVPDVADASLAELRAAPVAAVVVVAAASAVALRAAPVAVAVVVAAASAVALRAAPVVVVVVVAAASPAAVAARNARPAHAVSPSDAVVAVFGFAVARPHGVHPVK
jgi:hypothetical protein